MLVKGERMKRFVVAGLAAGGVGMAWWLFKKLFSEDKSQKEVPKKDFVLMDRVEELECEECGKKMEQRFLINPFDDVLPSLSILWLKRQCPECGAKMKIISSRVERSLKGWGKVEL